MARAFRFAPYTYDQAPWGWPCHYVMPPTPVTWVMANTYKCLQQWLAMLKPSFDLRFITSMIGSDKLINCYDIDINNDDITITTKVVKDW